MGARQARNLFNQFDARIVAQQTSIVPASAASRGRLKRLIRDCSGCNLSRGQVPVPFWTVPHPQFAVIGEVPTPDESTRGELTGPRILRTLIDESGLDSYALTYINTVSCVPRTDDKLRSPTREETGACRGNLMNQLEASGAKYVLLVGGKAFDAFRSDLTIADSHGKIMLWLDRYIVMGIYHPNAITRGKREYKYAIAEDLERWREIVHHDMGMDALLEETCAKCESMAVEWDRDCVPWCKKHWDQWQNQWEKERRKWDQTTVQLTL